jgi:hypothetical protein
MPGWFTISPPVFGVGVAVEIESLVEEAVADVEDTTRGPEILYAATDFGIHASWDAGANWLPVSQGLPVRSHPSTLRFVIEPDGTRRLYLFTFGRSAFE